MTRRLGTTAPHVIALEPKAITLDQVRPSAGAAMVDHFEWADHYRKRAASCRTIGEDVSSRKFRDCYRLLAKHYLSLADFEEDFARRAAVLDCTRNGDQANPK